jgi:hypothetical protein
MHRLKSEIWVAALLRRCQAQGQYGAVINKGAAEAGAVYVYINHLDGTYHLLSPPPGPAYDEQGERRFILEFENPENWQTVSAVVSRRQMFDPDLWAVEIEDRKDFAGLKPEKYSP